MMTSEEHGFDEEFVDIPANYLKCVICQYVLREPVQIMTCGHHYCHNCFERVKGYSVYFKSELRCPIDQKVIDLTKVFKDISIARVIDDLHVKCTFNNHGCMWTGELRDIEQHKHKCGHAIKESSIGQAQCLGGEVVSSSTTELIKGMCERLEQCEQNLITNEKDLAYIKFHLNETKEKLSKKEKEVEDLKQKVLKCEADNISNYKGIEGLKKGRMLQEEVEQQRINEVEKLQNEVEQLKEKMEEFTNKDVQPCKSLEQIATIETSLNSLRGVVEETKYDIQSTRTHLDEGLNEQLSKMKRHVSEKDKEVEELKQKVVKFEETSVSNHKEIESFKKGRMLQEGIEQQRNNKVEKLEYKVDELKEEVKGFTNKEIKSCESLERCASIETFDKVPTEHTVKEALGVGLPEVSSAPTQMDIVRRSLAEHPHLRGHQHVYQMQMQYINKGRGSGTTTDLDPAVPAVPPPIFVEDVKVRSTRTGHSNRAANINVDNRNPGSGNSSPNDERKVLSSSNASRTKPSLYTDD